MYGSGSVEGGGGQGKSIFTDDVSLQIFMEQLKILVSLFVFFAWFSSFCSLSGSLVPLALSVPRSRPHCLPRPPPTHTHTHTHSFSHSLFSGSLVCSVHVPFALRPWPFCSPSMSLLLSVHVPFALLRAPSPSRSRCLPRSPHHSQTLAHLPFPSPLPSSSLLSVLLLCCCLSRPLHHHPTLSLTLTPSPACSTFLDPSHYSFSLSLPLLGSSIIPCSLVPSLSCV